MIEEIAARGRRPPPTGAERRASRDRGLRISLAIIRARAGESDAARALLAELAEGPDVGHARRSLAMACARAGDVDAGLALCRSLDSPEVRADALIQMAGVLGRRGGR